MNHTLPHPLMITLLINYINTPLRKEWAQISMNHTPGQFHHYLFFHFLYFRDFNCSHEGGSKSAIPNKEITIMMPNKRVQ